MTDRYSQTSRLRSHRYARVYIIFSVFYLLLLVFLATGEPARAQETMEEIDAPIPTDHLAPPPVVDYAKTESVGLLGTQDQGSFGNGVYRGTKRSELTALLKEIKQSNWVSMRPLIKNFLLTEADSSALTQDIPVIAGDDLLTLRLNALLRLGYNREAFELYRKAAENELDQSTMLAGIYASLLTRQKGLACLDVKTVLPRYMDEHIWTMLNLYCEDTTAGKSDATPDADTDAQLLDNLFETPDYVYEYDPASFADMNMLKRALLSAEGKISTKYVTPQTISSIPPKDIAILLAQPDLDDLQKVLLLGAAIEYAIEPAGVITDFYKDLLERQKQNEESQEKVELNKDLLTLANLYKETTGSWTGAGRKEKLSEAMTLAQKYSDKLLIPFLPIISKLDIETEISIENALSIAPLYLFAADDVSQNWIKNLMKVNYPDQKQKEIQREKLLISLFLIYKNANGAFSNKVYDNISTHPLRSTIAKDVKNIIENIDSYPINSDKVRIKDANGFDLAADKRYKMPPYHVLSTLKQASENQDISVSLLLSSWILSKIEKQDTYIGTLSDITYALSNIGITTQPRHIIAQALMQAGKEDKKL